MATKKKLLQASAGSAGGADALNVEDVFSTYLYTGTGASQYITNDIKLADGDTDAQAFTSPGTYQWVCPTGVTSVNVVCVGAGGVGAAGSGGGGGELRYKNNISVTPGNSYTVVVGAGGGASGTYAGSSSFNGTTCVANGGQNGTSGSSTQAGGSGGTGDGGGNGGQGSSALNSYGSGGGAGGYSGNGGNGGNSNNHTAGTGGAGGGGASYISNNYLVAYGGGGVGIYGEGSSASKATSSNINGGSGGENGSTTASVNSGGLFGGGAGAANGSSLVSQRGGSGAVRIVWRSGSSFPSTNVGFSADGEGEGGMAWVKLRNSASNNELYDTERGATYSLVSNTSNATITRSNGVNEFTSTGFKVGDNTNVNANTYDVASWTFRNAPKFFDVVYSWTGDGTSSKTISHNLGSVPGAIFVKCTSTSDNWRVYHRSLGNTDMVAIDSTGTTFSSVNHWNNTSPTSTEFTVGANANVSGRTYVAYLFAHNDGDGDFGPDGDADIIKCGSYTGAYPSDVDIDLGFEAQWILFKNVDTVSDWVVYDTMRGFAHALGSGDADYSLSPGSSAAENGRTGAAKAGHPTPDGFKITSGLTALNSNGDKIIYIAIRRGQMATPTSSATVFDIDLQTDLNNFTTTPFPTDLVIQKPVDAQPWAVMDRMRGGTNILSTNSSAADNTAGTGNFETKFDYSNGVDLNYYSANTTNNIVYNWKRAPNFFDVVAYTGNGTAGHTVSHNLGVAPEMIWVKQRDVSRNWTCYFETLGTGVVIKLNDSTLAQSKTQRFDTTPTDSVFYLGSDTDVNSSGGDYIAYLFASVAGVSKVGSYTGNGTSQNIDCGFSSGARFVIIKKTSDTGSWFVYDTERGIVSGNDPYLWLNSTNAENTSTDSIDPHSSGFAVNYANTNANGATYIFYAIA